MELEIINKLFLELSQVATAKTARELALEQEIAEFEGRLKALWDKQEGTDRILEEANSKLVKIQAQRN